MSAIGESMFHSTALRQSSREKSLKSPGGGPPALLMRMSGCGQAASSALRPSSAVTSHTTGVTATPKADTAFAVALSASAPRAQIVTSTPSRAKAMAQPRPSPFDAAQTMALRPLMPRSMDAPPCSSLASDLRRLDRACPSRARQGGANEAERLLDHRRGHVEMRARPDPAAEEAHREPLPTHTRHELGRLEPRPARIEEHEVGVRVLHGHPADLTQACRQGLGMAVVLGQAVDVVIERIEASGGADAGLAQGAAEALLPAPGRID